MKLSSIKYLIKEGFRGTWANRLMSLASIGVLVACMVIIGLAMLISENVSKAVGNLEQQNVVMAYMKDYSWALYGEDDNPDDDADTESSAVSETEESKEEEKTEEDKEEKEDKTESEEETDKADANGIKESDYIIHNEKEAKALCDKIAKLPNVAEVEYISGDIGLDGLKDSLLEDQKDSFTFLDEKYGNPLSGAAKIKMKDMALFDQTIRELNRIEGISKIKSQDDLADKLNALKKGLGVAGVWVIAILMVISLVIVANTIRVTMYSRKLEISIMKAVGATDTFVRIPFVIEGVLIGLISALIAEGLLYFCYRVATETILTTLNTTNIVKYGEMAWWLLLVFAGIGIVSGVLSSVFIISKYLRKEGSEFAAI